MVYNKAKLLLKTRQKFLAETNPVIFPLIYSTVHVDVERFRLTPKTTTFKHKEDHFSIYNLQRQTSQEFQAEAIRDNDLSQSENRKQVFFLTGL